MSEERSKEPDLWIRRLKAITDSGTSTLGFLALLYILWTQTQILKENMERQTNALLEISKIYSGK